MKSKIRNDIHEINAGSMADIGFLLLIFFLVATTLISHKGLGLLLPPEDKQIAKINDRNVFKILINSENKILVEGEPLTNFQEFRKQSKAFVLNYGQDNKLSESPGKAIFSIKASRKARYQTFISVLDELKGVYYEIYSARVGITESEYRSLILSDLDDRKLYEDGKRGIPMNISLADPNK